MAQPGLVADPVHYRADVWWLSYGYFLHTEMWFSMILILLVGGRLISYVIGPLTALLAALLPS